MEIIDFAILVYALGYAGNVSASVVAGYIKDYLDRKIRQRKKHK